MKSSDSASGVRTVRILLLTLAVLLGTFAWLVKYAYSPPEVAETLSLDQVYRLAERGQIRFGRLLDEDAIVIGKLCPSGGRPGGGASDEPPELRRDAGAEMSACRPPYKPFQASYPRSDVSTQQLIERMTKGGATVEVEKQTTTSIIKLLLTFLFPLLILANLFGIIFVAKGGDSTMADIAGFGRLGKKRDNKHRPTTNVTFADVGGAEEAVAELREVTDYLKDPKKFEAYGASAPKGVLLFGPPGCGKTLIARAVAGESGVPFFSVSGAEFIESLVGVGAARVRDLFRQVREAAPAIVFIDEIDAVGRKRSGEGTTGGEREQTVNQLLVEMDGFEVTAGIVLMGATNRPDILDPALLRPGRFDRHVTLQAPDLHGREKILRLHARGKPISDDVDLEKVARRTPGFTGADLANVINEGALLAIREKKDQINAGHISEAIQRVFHGPQRRGKLMTAEERKRLAFHEAGHAVVAAALGRAESVQRTSIVARGRGLGSSAMSDDGDRVLLTQDELNASLAITMAGIAAEKAVLGTPSTTGEDDLAKANALAREIVGLHGMSDEVGPLRVLATDQGYLGSDARVVEAISGATLAQFDAEVKALMRSGEQTANDILASNRRQLETLAADLETQETLEGTALQEHLTAISIVSMARLNAVSPDGNPNLPVQGWRA